MSDEEDDRLTAAHFRGICTALWGTRYNSAAAAALGVQEARIKFWSNDDQDTSKYRVSVSVRRELEQMFMDRVPRSTKIIDRVNLMVDVLEYLGDLIDRCEEPPRH